MNRLQKPSQATRSVVLLVAVFVVEGTSSGVLVNVVPFFRLFSPLAPSFSTSARANDLNSPAVRFGEKLRSLRRVNRLRVCGHSGGTSEGAPGQFGDE